MGAPTGVDAEAMRLQNEEFKKENEELRSKLQSLTEKVRDSAYTLAYFLLLHSRGSFCPQYCIYPRIFFFVPQGRTPV